MKRVSHSHKPQAASAKQSVRDWIGIATTASLQLAACGLPLRMESER